MDFKLDKIESTLSFHGIFIKYIMKIVKYYAVVNGILLLSFLMILKADFWYFIMIVNAILSLMIAYLLISRNGRILYSISTDGKEIIFEYFYLFSTRAKIVLAKEISINYYYKQQGKNAELTLEFKYKNTFLMEVREKQDYGFGFSERKRAIEKLSLIVKETSDRSNVPVKEMFGYTVKL